MRAHAVQFLDPGLEFCDPDTAAAAVLPFGYEGGISHQGGTAQAPEAVLRASHELELYDEELDAEPVRAGIATLDPGPVPQTAEAAQALLEEQVEQLLRADKFPVVIGGDHSISGAVCRALLARHGRLSVVQLDAHADLRDEYQGSPLSHASIMARLRELTPHTLQLGIRSLSVEEARRIEAERLRVVTMHEWRGAGVDLRAELVRLPDPIFLTIDVDALDWSVVRSTGTPEPGGFGWHETLDLLRTIFACRRVAGCDVTELSFREGDFNSCFAVARLVYKLIGYKLARVLRDAGRPWPEQPGTLLGG